MSKKACPSCGEKINRRARFCEFCGHCLDGDSPVPSQGAPAEDPAGVDTTAAYLDEFDARESAQLSHEYFERHIEILAGYRKRLKLMAKGLDNREKKLAELAESGFTDSRTKEIQATLESIEAIGDEWEDLQLAYNQDSEVLDEEFQERFAVMEVDVELPEDLQEKMNRELNVMMHSFDKVGERIATIGTLGNRLIEQASGRWFTKSGTSSRRAALFWTSVAGSAGTFLALYLGQGADLKVSLTGAAAALLVPLLFVSRF